MTRQRDSDIKNIVKEVGLLFDARAKTLQIIINANMVAAINASEERIRKNMATKDDIKRLEQKIDKLEKSREFNRQIVN